MHSTPDVTMTAQQFKIVFQVTKEIRSIPEERLAEGGIPPHHSIDILELARDIRKAASAGRVEIHFISPDPSDRRILRILESTESEVSAEISTREFPSATARHWRPLIDAAVESLGEEELRFRTGYSKAEVDTVGSLLESLFTD